MSEEQVVADLEVAVALWRTAQKRMEEHFMPLIDQALAQSDIAAAMCILDRMPQSVAKMLAEDKIEEARNRIRAGDFIKLIRQP